MKHLTKLTLTSTTPEHICLKNRPRDIIKITFGFTMVVSVYKKGHNAEFNGKTTKAVHS